jgi:predicted dehydrogenase
LPALVEKPLAAAPAGVDELLDRARTGGVRLAVGYNLRFHPALREVAAAVAEGRVGRLLFVRAEVGSLLSRWHSESDYRQGSAAQRALGGGALLTLSHELDYVLWIAGPAALVTGAQAHVSALEMDVEDVAELVLRHDGGALSSVHVDLFDRTYNRRLRCVGDAATITWTWGGRVELGEDVLWDDPAFDLEATYVEELRGFLAGEPAPGDAVQDARRVLSIVEGVVGDG